MTEWISVKDKLPKNNEYVLIYYNFHPADFSESIPFKFKLTLFCTGGNVIEYLEDRPGYWLTHWDDKKPNWHLDDRYEVTYWMPLPNPPSN